MTNYSVPERCERRGRGTSASRTLSTRVRLGAALLVAIVMLANAALALEVCPRDVRGRCGGTCFLDVPVLVTGTDSLNAVGFDLVFDSSQIEFVSMRAGHVVQGWVVFSAQVLPGARVRVGGFTSAAFALNGTDTLAVLTFATLVGQGCTTFRTEALVDDLAGAAPCSSLGVWRNWGWPANGYIGVFPNAISTACCYDTPDATVLQVVVHTNGASAAGIRGAEFRIEVVPPAPGAQLTWAPSAAAQSSVGDPIDDTSAPLDSSGTVLAFASCEPPNQGTIVLGSITVTGLSGEHELLVKRHNRPTNDFLACAQFAVCGTASCASACMAATDGPESDPIVFRARVNSPSCASSPCGFVAVESRTWSDVKQIYR